MTHASGTSRGGSVTFQEVEELDHAGQPLVKMMPEPVVPALARPGMAVSDAATGESGVILRITRALCIYQTPTGEEYAATWHTVSLEAVQPDLDRMQP
ncbi:hypothetical protein ACERK3_07930 [Phycisphaerales bacterium AB-hyl4]|uniref:Uncharacterized protein n=1 Tax=Natronomicrosphaera hydrolytica TaxID=3242702 RepID=A0ABV4U7H1_9BACT